MKHRLTGIDHPVIGVRDMDAARASFERLGFIVPPRGRHREWGTGNWCIQFARDYLELRGVVEPHDVPQNRDLAGFLERSEGLMGVAFGTVGAAASHDSFAASGLRPRPVAALTRDFELPDGIVPVSFNLCFLPRDATPGLMHVVVCEHLTPTRLRRPGWLQHPNGACCVAGLVAVAHDPAAALGSWSLLFDDVARIDGGIRAAVGTGELLLLEPAAFALRYPGIALPDASDAPQLAAVVLGVRDLHATRDFLAAQSAVSEAGGRIVVPPSQACGTLIEFAQCRIP